MNNSTHQRITVLGATGSIGVSTLDVVARHPERYSVFALTADTKWELLAKQCVVHQPAFAVIRDDTYATCLSDTLKAAGLSTTVLVGTEGLAFVASHPDVDTVMAAIVGAAGLLPTLAAVNAGKRVLLANKEALVMAGGVFTQAVADSGAVLLPIDSEHNAIFQCLPNGDTNFLVEGVKTSGVRRILLTASGGPFRKTPIENLHHVTPEQACAHPNWSMGRKISVDSATMLNKGLELIEACWLFNVTPSDIQVVVHPQSVIHSMVEYVDGSVLAQLGNPDMRTPIAHALAWPQRIESGVASLDMFAIASLDFSAPDLIRFPCLRLAQEAATTGGSAPAILNAANEIAVQAFLNRHVGFTQIPSVVEACLTQLPSAAMATLDDVLQVDQLAREFAIRYIANGCS